MLQSSAEFGATDKVTDQKACYAKGLELLVRREHSRKELRGKLLLRSFSEDMVEHTLGLLEQEGFLNDARFAEAFVHYRYGKGQGPERIRSELMERGIEGQMASEPLNSAEYDWFEAAKKAYMRKYGAEYSGEIADINERMKRQRFMRYRGFTHEQIRYAQEGDRT
ncbi:MAG: recombination regulator RecX [Gammaproteobacteria bacterium]|nr:recombination regulator RecX [Gammaproteobacteria bacterium]MCW8983100.1 recombination regulator RecX [Gammaproteobacteria bacterium]